MALVQTFDEELLAVPPERVLLHVGQAGGILASAQVESGCVVLGKKCLREKQEAGWKGRKRVCSRGQRSKDSL